jgi:hypothetical protein
MGFKVFTDIGTRTKAFISVTENKTFGLPRAFLDANNITPEHKAVLLYDAEAKKIAIHFSLDEPKYGIAVRIPNAKHGGAIVAKNFFEIEKVDSYLYAGRYDDYEIVELRDIGINRDGKAFVITLKERPIEEDEEDYDGDAPIDLSKIPF